METCKCDWCGELFYSDDPEQGKCPTCTEEPVARANQERAVEQWLAYIRVLRANP